MRRAPRPVRSSARPPSFERPPPRYACPAACGGVDDDHTADTCLADFYDELEDSLDCGSDDGSDGSSADGPGAYADGGTPGVAECLGGDNSCASCCGACIDVLAEDFDDEHYQGDDDPNEGDDFDDPEYHDYIDLRNAPRCVCIGGYFPAYTGILLTPFNDCVYTLGGFDGLSSATEEAYIFGGDGDDAISLGGSNNNHVWGGDGTAEPRLKLLKTSEPFARRRRHGHC